MRLMLKNIYGALMEQGALRRMRLLARGIYKGARTHNGTKGKP